VANLFLPDCQILVQMQNPQNELQGNPDFGGRGEK
jgi:hypothetical protein